MDNKQTAKQYQEMWTKYSQNKSYINDILQHKLVIGLINNSIYKYKIPEYYKDDYKQHILLAIVKSFETYNESSCDKILPYICNGIYKTSMMFLTNIIGRDSKYLSIEENITTDSEVNQYEYDTSIDDTINEFQRWLQYKLPTLEYLIYCHQWGLFGFEKLSTDKLAEKFNLERTKVVRIKARILMKVNKHSKQIDCKNKRFIFD